MNKTVAWLCVAGGAWLGMSYAGEPLGMFEGSTGVGTLLTAGSAKYDGSTQSYTLSGSGENMWFAKDDFEFVWKKVSADNVSLAADVLLLGTGGDNHRKGVLMIRQTLEADSAYADAAVHGDGLTSLQFREDAGETTHEIEASATGPKRLRLEKRGDRFYLWIGSTSGDMTFAGGSTRVPVKSPFYVGIGVCAHNKDAVQSAAFSNVELKTAQEFGSARAYSTLQTVTVTSTDARVSYVSQEHLQNASWSADGSALKFQAGSAWKQVAYKGGTAEAGIAAESAVEDKTRISPDGKQKAVLIGSTEAGEQGDVVLAVVNVADQSTKVIAKLQGGEGTLSAHPWSPDSKRLTYVSYQVLP